MKYTDLYLTTQEFADLVVACVDEHLYKHDQKAHPEDIYYVFDTVASTVAKTLGWAIARDV